MWFWYSRNPLALLLLPLAGLFRLLTGLRRTLYRWRWLRSERLPVPVIVVGNLSVGGSGKTPLVIWLAERLRAAGYQPGVVSRGYGGTQRTWPCRVTADSDPALVGDEPVLIAARNGCPVVIDPDRPRGGRALLVLGCTLILADDGLQHYRLRRDLEIAVIDGRRGLGNGFSLPAGPLREPPSRLDSIDLIVGNGAAGPGQHLMRLHPGPVVNLARPRRQRPLDHWRGGRVHAVAGIGDPVRFFDLLREYGIDPIEHPFPDHHRFVPRELGFGDELDILMTEKDGVKCRRWASDKLWAVPVEATLADGFFEALRARLPEPEPTNNR